MKSDWMGPLLECLCSLAVNNSHDRQYRVFQHAEISKILAKNSFSSKDSFIMKVSLYQIYFSSTVKKALS